MNKSQVMLTFDDGTKDHLNASRHLDQWGLRGVFAIVPKMVGSVGFLTPDDLQDMKDRGHFICNHSYGHLWNGQGAPKDGVRPHPPANILADAIAGRETLNTAGFHGDFLCPPFGTMNIGGNEQLEELMKEFRWIRMTVGAPIPAEMGHWIPTGGKRLYPHGWCNRLVGIAAAADVRHPSQLSETLENATRNGALAILVFHSVCHVVGETMNIPWNLFVDEISYMAEMVRAGRLECVVPTDLVGDEV